MRELNKIREYFANGGIEVFISLYILPMRRFHIEPFENIFVMTYWSDDDPDNKHRIHGNLDTCLELLPWKYDHVIDYVE